MTHTHTHTLYSDSLDIISSNTAAVLKLNSPHERHQVDAHIQSYRSHTTSLARCPSSDERSPEALEAGLDADTGRLVDVLQRLELLSAQLVVGQLILSVEGLCGRTNNSVHSLLRTPAVGVTSTLTDVNVLLPQGHQRQEQDLSVDTPEGNKRRRDERSNRRQTKTRNETRPQPFGALRPPLDLSDQQVDRPVHIVRLDVTDDGVEERSDFLVVRRCQRPLLLH